MNKDLEDNANKTYINHTAVDSSVGPRIVKHGLLATIRDIGVLLVAIPMPNSPKFRGNAPTPNGEQSV